MTVPRGHAVAVDMNGVCKMQFKPASKEKARLRLALTGPAGSGKTWTSLMTATELSSRVAVIDTEHGSAAKYADRFTFDVLELEAYSPQLYIDAIDAAESAGYDVLVIDSLSHAWVGRDGALQLADREAQRMGGNKFIAWSKVTPLWQQLIDRILASRMHIIATLRSKTAYVIDRDERGKAVPRKVGVGPVIREGADFEFDIVGEMTTDHTLIVSKSRCRELDRGVIERPGKEFARTLTRWLSDTAQTDIAGSEGSTSFEPARPVERIEALRSLGLATYGEAWGAKASQLARWASKGRSEHLDDLLESEVDLLIEGIEGHQRTRRPVNAA